LRFDFIKTCNNICKARTFPNRTWFKNIHAHDTRSDEEADGRLRRVLGDGLAAECGEDRHGYQTQGGRRMCLNRDIFEIFTFLSFFKSYTQIALVARSPEPIY